MKRKKDNVVAPRKKRKLIIENERSPLLPVADFLTGVKCYIHPANFGAARLKLFQKQIALNGGHLCDVLPWSTKDPLHIIFEESVDIDQINRLIDPSRYTNTVFVRCTWLSACTKAKEKVDTKDHEISLAASKPTGGNKGATRPLMSEKTRDKEHKSAETIALHATEEENVILQTNANIVDKLEERSDIQTKNIDEINRNCNTENEKESTLHKAFPAQFKEKFVCAHPSSSKVKDHNQHITAELEKLAAAYKSKKDTWRALGYQKAISAIRNHPRPITSREDALNIHGIGERLADKVAEIVTSGKLRKVAEVCEGEEAETLQLFMGVWGAGPTTCHNWYLQGFRTLDDLREKATLSKHQEIGLRHYDDINSRIPRDEVAEIEDYVRLTALSIQKGLLVQVCGSYRRGKLTCGDVDVLLTHPDGHSHEKIFQPLLNKLHDTGFLTDDLVMKEDNGNQKKYLGVCKLPGEGRKHRRLDVIVVPFSEYAPALMYFTGSAHCNRSMRLLATKMGMSLSEHGLRAGIIRQGGEKLNDGHLLDTPTEESIFKLLGLEYRTPQERDH